MKQNSASVARRRMKTRLSPLPGFSPYLEELQRRSLSPTIRKMERVRRKKNQKTIPQIGLKTMLIRDFSPENEVMATSFRHEKLTNEYSECTEKLKSLRQAYSNVMRENLTLLSSLSRPSNGWKDVSSSFQPLFQSSELHDLSDEQEQQYTLLSSSHSSISQLLAKHRLLAHDLAKSQRELGLLRYQQELKRASTAVKSTLVRFTQLEEVVRHRSHDHAQLTTVLETLRSEKDSMEEEVANLHCENLELVARANALLETVPDLMAASDTAYQLAVVTGKLQISEQRCRALEVSLQAS